jgi:hypothetical protein
MFSWLRATCPVDPHAKQWVENRLAWLIDEFGADDFLHRPLILPTHSFFPDLYDGSDASIRTLVDRVSGYMGADSSQVDIELFKDRGDFWLVNDRGQAMPRAAGWYEETDRVTIQLELSQLGEPLHLVGTIAHELAHLRLLGERRIHFDVFDNELLTDLTVVFHGLGIFLANSPRAWESQFSHWPDSEVRRPEYMTLPMYGYALAHQAWLRDESQPAWAKFLRMDARACFRQGLQYLRQTGDSELRDRRV